MFGGGGAEALWKPQVWPLQHMLGRWTFTSDIRNLFSFPEKNKLFISYAVAETSRT